MGCSRESMGSGRVGVSAIVPQVQLIAVGVVIVAKIAFGSSKLSSRKYRICANIQPKDGQDSLNFGLYDICVDAGKVNLTWGE
jgi:hypothetical protein